MALQRNLFLAILLLGAGIFTWQALRLLPLFLSAEERDAIRTTVTAVAANEGWLLSDIDAKDIDEYGMTFIHHEHRRGSDRKTCYGVKFDGTALLIPCNGELN